MYVDDDDGDVVESECVSDPAIAKCFSAYLSTNLKVDTEILSIFVFGSGTSWDSA